jgi:hypothetical protein
MIQGASDAGNTAGFVYFIFDLLHLDGEDVGVLPLIERKGAGCRFAVERWSPTALQRLSPRAGDGFPSKSLRIVARGDCLKTRRRRVCARQSWRVA